MKDRTYDFLYKYYGVYKTRIRLFFFILSLYVIATLLLIFKIWTLPAWIFTPIYMIEMIIMIIYDGESFERRHRRF